MTGVAAAWERIEAWLSRRAPQIVALLPQAASQHDLADLEHRLGRRLPDELRDLLRLRNGSGDVWLHHYGAFLGTDRIYQVWSMLDELWSDGCNDEWATPQGPIRSKWWSPHWLPIVGDWSGNCLFLDFDPPPQGQLGQVVYWANNGGPRRVIANGFELLLCEFADALESSAYDVGATSGGHPFLAQRS